MLHKYTTNTTLQTCKHLHCISPFTSINVESEVSANKKQHETTREGQGGKLQVFRVKKLKVREKWNDPSVLNVQTKPCQFQTKQPTVHPRFGENYPHASQLRKRKMAANCFTLWLVNSYTQDNLYCRAFNF